MSELTELLTSEDLEKVWSVSKEKPVFLFKQSTTCPISANAFREYNSFSESINEDVGLFFVKVRETREVSNEVAEKMGVQHQSPQALLIKNNEAVWNTSHSNITVDSLNSALKANQ